jgi:hypothetical protein
MEAIKVIGTILASEMDLVSQGQDSQIMLEYQRFNIPKNNKLYVALAYVGPNMIVGNTNFYRDTDGVLEEVQQVSMLYQIQIDAMSFGPEARLRFPEIALALRSIKAQQLMEANGMQIARQPAPFIDTASLEETKYLNRFTTTIKMTALTTKVKAVAPTDTYETFPFQIDSDGKESQILYPEAKHV